MSANSRPISSTYQHDYKPYNLRYAFLERAYMPYNERYAFLEHVCRKRPTTNADGDEKEDQRWLSQCLYGIPWRRHVTVTHLSDQPSVAWIGPPGSQHIVGVGLEAGGGGDRQRQRGQTAAQAQKSYQERSADAEVRKTVTSPWNW